MIRTKTKFKTQYKPVQYQWRERPEPRHRYWDILDKEETLILFKEKEDLKYCREYYRDGIGTRKIDKMIETNWGFYEDMEIVGYSVDKNGKVMRVFANRYGGEGDDVCESILWDTITIGKPSKLKYINKEFRHN